MNQFVFESARPVVQTAAGRLRGVTYGDVNIFMGVPYAKAKRFHMPEPVEPWEGIRNAYNHGPIAMQLFGANPFAYYRGLHMLEKQSEDCQNLNIWAPKTLNSEKKPVIVWIHGGGYSSGNAFEEASFDGFNLAHYGDVVFVSVNHRLNLLGFLNLEDYGAEFANSGNAGLFDLAEAIRWIHRNIGAFGGDPDNVTLLGHSGGGGKVQCLFQIEDIAPFFRRGICLSGAETGSGSPCMTREGSRQVARDIMNEVGITKENIDAVYEIPFDKLADACFRVAGPFMFSPIQNEYFAGFPYLTQLMPFSKDKPFIYGSMLGEFPICDLTAEDKEAMTEDDKIAFLRKRFGETADSVISLFRAAYPAHDVLDLACLDSQSRIAAVKSAVMHAKAGCKNAYVFLAAYDVPENGSMPIWHGGEVGYMFMNEDKVLVLNDAVYGQKYSQIFSTLLLNFARTGDPNNKYLPVWKPVTEEENWTMIIDRECRCEAGHDTELIRTYDPVAPKFVLNLKRN